MNDDCYCCELDKSSYDDCCYTQSLTISTVMSSRRLTVWLVG